jgi:hypothetical protein
VAIHGLHIVIKTLGAPTHIALWSTHKLPAALFSSAIAAQNSSDSYHATKRYVVVQQNIIFKPIHTAAT